MIDNKEFVDFLNTYKKELFNYCYCRLSYNLSLTEDTYSDVLRILYQKWNKLKTKDNIRAFMYRVADNCIKNNKRKHNKYYYNNESFEEALENRKFDKLYQCDLYFADGEDDIEKRIDEIKDSLPAEYKDIFILRYINKKTINEITNITGIPYSSVRLKLSKIEKIVREKIERLYH